MPLYKFESLDSGGKKKTGLIEAQNEQDAKDKVKQSYGYLVSINEQTPKDFSWSNIFAPKITNKDIMGITRQMATLLNAGLALDEVLSGMAARQDNVSLKNLLCSVRDSIREGSSLAKALGQYKKYFSPTYIALISAGEASGSLDVILARLAEDLAKSENLSNKVRTALTYPVFMLVTGVVIVGCLLVFIVPQITGLFINAKQSLPMATVILLGLSDFVQNYWIFLLIAPFIIYYFVHRLLKQAKWRRRYHQLLLKMPVFGSLNRSALINKFSYSLAMLLRSGVELLEALRITKNVADNALMEEAITELISNAQAGAGIAATMQNISIFPSDCVQLVAAGEKSGQLEHMLFVIASDQEEKVNTQMQKTMALIEPVMILTIGVMMAFVILAIMLPIFEMSNLVN